MRTRTTISTRRTLWAGLAIVATSAVAIPVLAGPLGAANPANPGRAKPTVVLEHGAWADGSSWSGVVDELQRRGYPVVAPPNPLRGLANDAAYLASFLSTIKGPVIVVGHSYGGAVITNAATGNTAVKALVFVDAFIPDERDTLLGLVGSESCLSGGGDPAKVFNFVQDPGLPTGDPDLFAKPDPTSAYPGFAACFANDLPAAQGAVAAATQRPIALGALGDPSGVPAWKTIPSWALIGTIDRVITPAQQLSMANHARAHIDRVKASHLSPISRPDAVVDLIVDADRATS
ncbi:MAG TPA: alpha/beta hydrolase [Acidimicrobiales bacterium]